jgi:hemerythrin-like metal-binding protein
MAIVEWSDDFKIGEPKIDKEHWGLFALIHDLGDKLAQGAAEGSIKATIEALAAYVDIHFEHEERLMQQTGYPAFGAHKKAHEALTQQVADFQNDFQRAPETFDYDGLMEFLSNWLSEHILKVDMKFAEFHKAQAA